MSQIKDWMHGTGIAVDPTLSPEEKLQAANLNYDVITVPAGYYVNGEWITSKNKYTIRADQPSINYGLVHNRKAWSNKEFLTVLEDYLKLEGYAITHIGSIDHGGITYYGVELPVTYLDGNEHEETHHYLLVSHGHKNGTGVMVSKFSNRTYCTNGLNIIIRKPRVVTHSSELTSTVVFTVRGAIKQAIDLVDTDIKYDRILADQKVSDYKVKQHLLTLYGKKDDGGTVLSDQPKSVLKTVDKVLNIYYNGNHRTKYTENTAYGLLQAVMEYEAHHRKTKDPDNSGKVMKSLLGFSSGTDTRYHRINFFRKYLESCYLKEVEYKQLELIF